MPTRRCGRVKIVCRLVPAPNTPHGEQYKCSLSVGGKKKSTEYVGLPAFLGQAIDSPQMVDGVAQAAVVFASDAGKIHDDDCDFKDDMFHITRGRKHVGHAKHKRSYGRR